MFRGAQTESSVGGGGGLAFQQTVLEPLDTRRQQGEPRSTSPPYTNINSKQLTGLSVNQTRTPWGLPRRRRHQQRIPPAADLAQRRTPTRLRTPPAADPRSAADPHAAAGRNQQRPDEAAETRVERAEARRAPTRGLAHPGRARPHSAHRPLSGRGWGQAGGGSGRG